MLHNSVFINVTNCFNSLILIKTFGIIWMQAISSNFSALTLIMKELKKVKTIYEQSLHNNIQHKKGFVYRLAHRQTNSINGEIYLRRHSSFLVINKLILARIQISNINKRNLLNSSEVRMKLFTISWTCLVMEATPTEERSG